MMNQNRMTLVFDWGDTLMRVLPEYKGPMAGWPEVQAVDGAVEALRLLSESATLVVATNATESRSFQVRQALARVDLDGFFTAVFTARELDARKPDPAFFHAMQSVLDQSPAQCCMIGDSFSDDVLGAKQAGWSAVWYNPTNQPAPGLLPLYDAEITHFSQLAETLAAASPPDYLTCQAWLLQQEATANLMAHVHAVAASAYLMAVWLRGAGQPVDPLLTHRAGLLHDLAKIKTIRKGSDARISHGEMAGLMLKDRGYPVLAEIARRHQLYSLNDPDTAPRTWEEKLVYFADKLVEGSRLASLDERLAALARRYPDESEIITRTGPALKVLQEEICSAAQIEPDALVPRLREAFTR